MSLVTIRSSSTIFDYTLGRTIGMSGLSKVKLGTDPEGNEIAVKIYELDDRYIVERTMM